MLMVKNYYLPIGITQMKKQKEDRSISNSALPERVKVHFIKDSSYRAYYADGVWGGPTPKGMVSMSIYSERMPIPKKILYRFVDSEEHGTKIGVQLGKAEEIKSKEDIIRQVHCELIMNPEVAESIGNWLKKIAKEIKEDITKQNL